MTYPCNTCRIPLILSTIRNDGFDQSWDLDALGNWSEFDDNGDTQTRDTNAANEIVEVEGSAANVAHDAVGNMTRVPKPGDAAAYYDLVYDAWNRLISVVQDDGQGGDESVAEYEYAGDNRRVVKHAYAVGTLDETRHFYYTGEWQCVEERTEAGGVIAANADMQYVWGEQYIDALILRDRDTTADGTLDERLYALQDANWNVTAVAETDGDIIERYTYTAYGTVEVRDADFVATAAASAFAWQYTYTTRRLDDETGLMHYRNRMYHTELGRFVSRDPVGYEGGDFNLYRYVLNNPITATDPSGLAPPYCSADPGYMGIGSMGNQIKQWEHEAAVAKAKQLCANVDYCSEGCKNKECTKDSCVAAMTTFVEAVNDTWILPSGWNRCSRWVRDLNSRIPDDFGKNPCISGYNLEKHDMYAYGGATRVHWTFYVRLCDGTKINADEGAWGGSDHLF